MTMKIILLSISLLFTCVVDALPNSTFQNKDSNASRTQASDEIEILQKRSPLPQPVGGERIRSRPASYFEMPNELDTELDPIIPATDYLGLVNKAIESAHKVNPRSSNDLYIKDGAVKWLTRAQASMTRDLNLLHENQYRYATKMADARLPPQLRDRAREKMEEWTNIVAAPMRPELGHLINHVGASYRRDVKDLEGELAEQRQLAASQLEIIRTTRLLKHAKEAVRLWNSNLDSRTAFQMMNKELELYVEEAQNPSGLEAAMVRANMTDLAIKAIAWLRRARELQSRVE